MTRTVLILLILLVAVSMLPAQELGELGLDEHELHWLENHRKIRVAGPRAFPPFYFYEDGEAKGIGADTLFRVADILGLELEIMADLAWTDVLSGVRAGDIDLVAVAAETPDRQLFMEFSDPYLSFPMVIITRKDAPFVSGVEDLTGQSVAFIQSASTFEWVMKDGIDVIPRYVQTPLEALQKVSMGRVDAHIANLAAVTYLVQHYGLTNLKIAAPTKYGNYDLHFAARRDWHKLIAIIDKTLAAIPATEHADIRNRWISVRYEYGLRFTDILRWVAVVAGFFALLVTVILFWNRRLQREIVQRRRVEQSLKDTLTRVKTLHGLLPICAWCKKVRNDEGYWDQIEQYIRDNSDAEISHGLCPDCARRIETQQHRTEL